MSTVLDKTMIKGLDVVYNAEMNSALLRWVGDNDGEPKVVAFPFQNGSSTLDGLNGVPALALLELVATHIQATRSGGFYDSALSHITAAMRDLDAGDATRDIPRYMETQPQGEAASDCTQCPPPPKETR